MYKNKSDAPYIYLYKYTIYSTEITPPMLNYVNLLRHNNPYLVRLLNIKIISIAAKREYIQKQAPSLQRGCYI